MALTDDTQLNTLFDAFLASLATAAAADVALQGAVENLAALREASLTAQNAARVAYNDFLRRIGSQAMSGSQRQAFRRVFGELDDLNPNELGGAVRRALEG